MAFGVIHANVFQEKMPNKLLVRSTAISPAVLLNVCVNLDLCAGTSSTFNHSLFFQIG